MIIIRLLACAFMQFIFLVGYIVLSDPEAILFASPFVFDWFATQMIIGTLFMFITLFLLEEINHEKD